MKRLIILILLLTGLALAVSYRLASESLRDNVEQAFAAWLELDNSLEISEDSEATTRFELADSDLLGPDTISLTVLKQMGEREVSILLADGDSLERALLHEVGLLLGAPLAESGVMNPAISGDKDTTLGDAERLALQVQQRFAKEDINRDGVVDFYDLAELAKAFGRRGLNDAADLNDDGVVDRADLEILKRAYTFTAPSDIPPSERQAPEALDDAENDPSSENDIEENLPLEETEDNPPPEDDPEGSPETTEDEDSENGD